MRQTAIGILMLGVGIAGPSLTLADEAKGGKDFIGHADVDAHIDWNKTVNVDENVYVEKALFIKAINKIPTPGGGEASAIANVGNLKGSYNNLTDMKAEPGIYGGGWVSVSATIDDAVNFNTGVMQVNQDTGVMSNQGNLLAISDTTGSNQTGLGDSQAEVSQANTGNVIVRNSAHDALGAYSVAENFTVDRKATMTNAANANLGIININQNAGELNNQTNANSVGVGSLGIVIVGEAALGQATGGNHVYTANSQSTSTIQDSMNNNISQISVNQASGGANSQSSTFNFSALLSFSTPGVGPLKF